MPEPKNNINIQKHNRINGIIERNSDTQMPIDTNRCLHNTSVYRAHQERQLITLVTFKF
jgi:hypothetical protein